MTEHYDLIIIGSGAGGGTLAHRLAPTGKRILLLERGDYLPRERENWDATAVFVAGEVQANETWYGSDGRAFHPGIHYYVGGNTKVYGAALFRLRKRGFRRDPASRRHLAGLAGRLRRVRAILSEAEELYCVHGQHGDGPDRARSSKPYAYPPVSHEPRIQELHDAFVREGLHPFPLPLGVLLDETERQAAAYERLHPLRRLRRLSLPGQRQGGCAGHLRRSGAPQSATSRC